MAGREVVTQEPTEVLIARLAAAAEPVTRLAPAPRRLARRALEVAVSVGVGLLMFGMRDLSGAGAEPGFGASLSLAVALVGFATWAAVLLAVPGEPLARAAMRFALMAALGWVVVPVGLQLARPDGVRALVAEPWHLACGARILAMALPIAWLALRGLTRGAPLEPTGAAAAATLGALGAAVLGIQLICPIGHLAHVVVSHVLPAGLLAALGILWGRAALRRTIADWAAATRPGIL
jgi:hypothetical protein